MGTRKMIVAMSKFENEDGSARMAEGSLKEMHPCDIVISNGFGRFHLGSAATEVHRHGRLASYLTGFYPSRRIQQAFKLSLMSKMSRVKQLFDRKLRMPEKYIFSLAYPECVSYLGGYLENSFLLNYGRHIYARKACGILGKTDFNLLHYRSGFGHASARLARSREMVTLCDHSIAHPGLLGYLIENKGRFPSAAQNPPVNRFWRDISEDLQNADEILVCSEFVRETFLNRGHDPDKIHVIYYGVDDQFLAHLDEVTSGFDFASRANKSLRLIFAGQFCQRKGAIELVNALSGLTDVSWKLELVGKVDQEIETRFSKFLSDSRVVRLGVLTRRALAERLVGSDILVFPSLAEGSARVIFDGLAAGCYVITTKNSGSIVKEGIHGTLVETGNVKGLMDSIRAAAADRKRVSAIGQQNMLEIRENWSQKDYGRKLIDLYDKLIEKKLKSRRYLSN